MENAFADRFNDIRVHRTEVYLFVDPFGLDNDFVPSEYQMELIDLQGDDDLKAQLRHFSLSQFYQAASFKCAMPQLYKNDLVHIAMFCST